MPYIWSIICLQIFIYVYLACSIFPWFFWGRSMFMYTNVSSLMFILFFQLILLFKGLLPHIFQLMLRTSQWGDLESKNLLFIWLFESDFNQNIRVIFFQNYIMFLLSPTISNTDKSSKLGTISTRV